MDTQVNISTTEPNPNPDPNLDTLTDTNIE
jgi:hypothetical protein